MLVYEDYHFGEPQEMALYHIEDFSHFAHLHRSYELLYVVKGSLTAFVDNRPFPMKPGDFILILPYEIHSYRNENHAECYISVFSPDYIQEFYKLTAKQALEKPVFRLMFVKRTSSTRMVSKKDASMRSRSSTMDEHSESA